MILSLLWLVSLVFLGVYFTISWAMIYHLNKFGLRADPSYRYLAVVFVLGTLILVAWGFFTLVSLNNIR